MNVRLILLAVALTIIASPESLEGQSTTYQLADDSSMETGCTGPSMCLCPAVLVGDVSGTFDLTPVPLSLGPVFEYDVTNVDWIVNAGSADEVSVTGSGYYMVNFGSGNHDLVLELQLGGLTQEFVTAGFIPGASDFPDQLGFSVHSMVSVCIYDGFVIQAAPIGTDPMFDRGDCNADENFDVADPVAALFWLFTPSTSFPPCADACDANDDGAFDISDAIYALAALFSGGTLPPAPFGGCGVDPTMDGVSCFEFLPCL